MPYFLLAIVIAVAVAGWWWRYRHYPCPASASWLLENPLMNRLAGAALLIQRADLHEGMRLLDAGCGTGRITLPAADRVGASGEVTALDIQPKMLDKLHKQVMTRKLTNIHPVLGGCGTGLLEKNYFDRAILVTVLGEVQHKSRALSEIHEALKPGGILSITELMLDPHYLSHATISRLCTEAGFREVELFGSRLCYTVNFIKVEQG